VPEETKRHVVYLKGGKKFIFTKHVKYIDTLSRAQNASLLDSPPIDEQSRNARTANPLPQMINLETKTQTAAFHHTCLINESRLEDIVALAYCVLHRRYED
jgi:hypothetical protein